MFSISQWMTFVLAAALVVFAVRAAFAPRAAALAFGVSLPSGVAPTPYLTVKADRDVVLAALLVVVALAGHSVLGSALLAGAAAPAADAWIVAHHGKPSGMAVHLATFAFMLVAGVLAFAGR